MAHDAPLFKRRPCASCCATSVCLILLIIIIIIILAFTVFKPKKPEIDVQRIELQDIKVSLGRSGIILKPSINITLALVLSVHNPNEASFKYTQSSSRAFYHGDEVAIVPIPAGAIESQGSETISTTLHVLANQLISNSQLLGDFLAGSLPFSVSTDLSGRVKVLSVIKHHVDISSQCSFSISIASKSIDTTDCQTTVRL